MTMAERFRRTRDWGAMKIATHLPARIRYWDAVTQLSKVSTKLSNREAPSITMDEILKNLDRPGRMS